MSEFTLSGTVPTSYDDTVVRVRDLLADAGFGILTEIDLQATLRQKLDVEVPPQVILGACRPQLAHVAVEADPRIATMLPCNVVVASEGEERTRVEVFDPEAMVSFSEADRIAEVAADARQRLVGVIETLTADEGGTA